MKTAIEVLERSLKSHTNTRNSWASITDEDLSEDIADFDEKIDEIKAAIDYLQRKVKKDPRVDGLPEGGVIMLIYPKTGKPYTGRYLDNGYWDDGTECMYGDKYPQYRTTDEILFYADPNDIL